jgi:hypothetical protein
MIGDFRVALTCATGARNIVLSWRSVPVGAPVKPDGFFCLQFPDRPDGNNRAFFFLEADRSTMTRERFVQKLVNYWRWYRADGHTEQLGIKRFRVLTVTKSDERARSLLTATTATAELHSALAMFWFASEHLFDAQTSDLFASIWNVAGEREPRSLLPFPLPTT